MSEDPDEPQARYLAPTAIAEAVRRLHGSANHLLKIWFTLKQMGLKVDGPQVKITTGSPTDALQRLFAYGSTDGDLFVPFAHTTRFKKMEHDAARSIVQTNIRNWHNRSVVSCDPTEFLQISEGAAGTLLVGTQRTYPLGLGFGPNGFALEDGVRVNVPLLSFAVWYWRQQPIPMEIADADVAGWLVDTLLKSLSISDSERVAVFVEDKWQPETAADPIDDEALFALCNDLIANALPTLVVPPQDDRASHTLRIRSMQTVTTQPKWLSQDPSARLKSIIDAGARAVLLFGPPRTGKTRAIDLLTPRESTDRTTIHIHDGWGYDQLIEGLVPDETGRWKWTPGPLRRAIGDKKKVIVLEEINRTDFTQALGEVFGLIEEAYRGESHALVLRSGDKLWIDKSTILLMTMNTLDKSTEDVDDALIGRCAAIEFPPRVEDLTAILRERRVPDADADKMRELFAFILGYYPLGPGYFAGVSSPFIDYYVARVRPVLFNHFNSFRPDTLSLIDTKVDELFGRTA